MASRLNLARLGAAVLGASAALVLSAALPANADNGGGTTSTGTGTVVTVSPSTLANDVDGNAVTETYPGDNGKQVQVNVMPQLIAAQLANGQYVLTYCSALNVAIPQNSTISMEQEPWSKYPIANVGFDKYSEQINWILHNSYPMVNDSQLPALAKTAGFSGTLTQKDAITATQAAIWHYSNDATLDLTKVDAGATALYTYLTGSANIGLAQPSGDSTPVNNPTLSITPDKGITGKAGDKIGPFTVNTNLGQVELNSQLPTGVTITDSTGKAIDTTKIANGSQLYFDVPSGQKAGSASITLSTPDTIGELYVATKVTGPQGFGQQRNVQPNCAPSLQSQLLIIAQTPISAGANANWSGSVATPPSSSPTAPTSTTTVAPSTTTSTPAVVAPTTTASTGTGGGHPLPYTGVSIIAPVALAIVLIGAGGTFLILQRRRRRA